MGDPPSKLYFNGQAYNSFEELPEEFRRYLKDENQNGVPDIIENMLGGKLAEMMKNPTFQRFAFQDKIFEKLEQLPPEQQQRVREKLERLNTFFNSGASSNPPLASGSTNVPLSSQPSVFASSAPALGGAYSPVRSGPSKVFVLLVAVIGLLILGFVAGLWLLLVK